MIFYLVNNYYLLSVNGFIAKFDLRHAQTVDSRRTRREMNVREVNKFKWIPRKIVSGLALFPCCFFTFTGSFTAVLV